MSTPITLTRRLPLTGALVKVSLEPCGQDDEGRYLVRLAQVSRKTQGSSQWRRWKEEEGQICPFASLGFAQRSYESTFGVAHV